MSEADPTGASATPSPDVPGCWGRAGVGCVTFVGGAWSGAMIGVLIGEIVGFFLRVPDCQGLPVSCNWAAYAGIGAVVGGISLPALALWRIRRGGRDDGSQGTSNRG